MEEECGTVQFLILSLLSIDNKKLRTVDAV